MTTLLQDMRYGLRLLGKSPGFTIVAALSLALGVGANTAIFSIVHAVLLRSLPFSHPDRLVKIVANNKGTGARNIGFSVPEMDDLRSRAGVFDQVTAIFGGDTNLTGAERPQRLELLEVSPGYFSMLGTSAHIGRVFGPGDETPGFADVAIISDSLWTRGFGRDPGVLGRKMQLTVVGVIAEIRNDGLDQAESPHFYSPIYQVPRPLSLTVTVRTSLPAASLEPLIRREIQAVDPDLPVFNVRTMNEVIDGSLASRRFSAELVGVFAVVALLLASVGIYGLLAYMVGQRAHEIGVRMALGAMPSTIGKMIVSRGAGLAGIGVGGRPDPVESHGSADFKFALRSQTA